MSVESASWATGSSYAQQEAMMRFLANRCGADIRYESSEEKHRNGGAVTCTAIVTLDGEEHKFLGNGMKA